MNEDFEQRLRGMFGASDELPVSERFGGAVRERIAGLRRARRIMLTIAAVTAVAAVSILGAPLLTSSIMLVADAPGALNGALSALLVSPAGYVLGASTAAAALAAAFSD